MSLTPVNFITSASATATNGSDTITVTGNVDCSNIYKASAVFLGTRQVVQAISGTAPDGSGNSTIKLKVPWADPTTTAKLVVFNTFEDLSNAVKIMRNFIEGLGAIMETGTGTAYFDGTGWILRNFDPNSLGTAASENVTTGNIDTVDGRVLKVGNFGIGSKSATLINGDFDVNSYGGSFFGYGGQHPSASTGTNPFPNHAGAIGVFVNGAAFNDSTAEYIFQLAAKHSPAVNGDELAFRACAGSPGLSGREWAYIWHSGNLNVDEFGGVSTDDSFGNGVNVSTTVSQIFLPISSYIAPSSITVVGTFKLVGSNGATVRSGIPATDITLSGNSSNKVMRLIVSNSTGLNASEFVELRGETSTSKITGNF